MIFTSSRRWALLALGGVAAALVIAAPAIASPPDRTLLEGALKTLERNLPVEKGCETLFTRLSSDLTAKKVRTRAVLKSRQRSARGCFAEVEKQFVGARASLRQVLNSNGVSEQTPQAKVVSKGWTVAYSWLLAKHVTSFSPVLDRATAFVDAARLGAPLGADPLWETLHQEPTVAIATLLSLQKHRTVLAKACAAARKDALG